MDTLVGLLSLFLVALTAHAADDAEPSVAFMCGRPAMYRTGKGWTKDDSTDCMKDPVDILNYCRKVYPTLDVRNVVESSKKVTISKWCGFGHNRCHHEYTVRPFRCLVGSFQSDALLVPEHCLFDHIHDSKECKNYADWNKTAIRSCTDRGMVQQAFAILQPCGIDRFNGVEFVCCPKEDDIDQFLKEEFEYLSTDAPKKPTTSSTTTTTTEAPTTTTTTVPEPSTTHQVPSESPANDVYDKYLHNVAGQFLNEHEYFMKAKTQLEKHHHEAVTKMMKEWAEARQHVQDLKTVDPKGAEKLNKEITGRFQKTYEALEQEGMAEKKQLVALHQQRVQAGLNEKKRHAMEHFMDVLTEEEPDTTHILKALEHYIKAEQKDRLHSINHFKHLRDTDPSEAEAVREQTLNHLDLIQARVQQAVDMLNRVPKYEKKIREQIDDYLQTFQPLQSSITKLLSTPIDLRTGDFTPDLKPADVMIDYQGQQVVPQAPETPAPAPLSDLSEIDEASSSEEDEDEDLLSDEDEEDSEEDSDEEFEDEDLDDYDSSEEDELDSEEDEDEEDEEEEDSSEQEFVVKKPLLPISPQHQKPEMAQKEFSDEEVMENEHDFVAINRQPVAAHHGDSFHDGSMDVQSYISEERVTARSFSAPTLAVAIGSVTVFIVIVVGIVVLRRRALRVPSNGHGFVEVDTAASPEEKHVANMQLNGYENPTYKYFEMNGNSA